MNNSDIVSAFLASYEKHDAEGMAVYLDAGVVFSDLAFERITGDNVRAMWAWFCEPSPTRDDKPVKVRNSEVTRVDGDRVQARYEVDYTLTEEKKPRRTVRYVILSDFTLRDCRIISQRDTPSISQFAFAKMALGFPGCLLALTPLFRPILRSKMCAKLLDYRARPVRRAVSEPAPTADTPHRAGTT